MQVVIVRATYWADCLETQDQKRSLCDDVCVFCVNVSVRRVRVRRRKRCELDDLETFSSSATNKIILMAQIELVIKRDL